VTLGPPVASSAPMRVVDLVLGAAAHAMLGAVTRRRRAGDGDDARGTEAVRREREQRLAERSGRTRAERALRAAKLELEAMRATVKGENDDSRDGDGDASRASAAYAMKPCGTFASVFNRRNGTPRQPSLVPLARGRVTLDRRVPSSALEGLEEFTHCWLVYVFHENTDLATALEEDGKTGAADGRKSTVRGKIRVPRLNGEKRGCLATRTPHRPCPIGLSLVEIVRVGDRTLDVAGADLVDGTPVLDVKPYVPYSDCIAAARAPEWVGNNLTDGDGPLAVDEVKFTEEGDAAVRAAWLRRRKTSLYQSADEFIAFVVQALGRDIRSYHQRLKMNKDEASNDVDWRVSLDGVVIVYRQLEKSVQVRGVADAL